MTDTATAYPCLLPLLPERTPILFGAAMCLCKQAHLLPHGSETISCQWLISWGFLGKLLSNAIRLCPFLLPACSCRSRAVSGAAISQARKHMHQVRRQHAEDGKEERAKPWDGMAPSLNSLTSHGCLLPASRLPMGEKKSLFYTDPIYHTHTYKERERSKDPDAGKDWGQEKRTTEDEMGWMASLTQ